MKLTSYFRLASLTFLGLGLSFLPGSLSGQTYEFEYLTTDTDFSPTYLWVTAALDAPSSASSSILNYEINTRLGTWTPAYFDSKNSGMKSEPPFWATGMIELVNGGQTLDFLTTAHLESKQGSLGEESNNVYLTTTSVSSILGEQASTGTWSLVSVSNVPDQSETLWLLLSAGSALCLRRKSDRAQTRK